MFHKNRNFNELTLATLSVSGALFWLFFGNKLASFIGLSDNSYLFASGSILTLGIVGITVFIRTILYYTEFYVQGENLPLLLYRIAAKNHINGVFFKDEKGVYRFVNLIAKRVLGLESQVVTGQKDEQSRRMASGLGLGSQLHTNLGPSLLHRPAPGGWPPERLHRLR